MDTTVVTYLVYLAISISLTVWVARTLSHNGQAFLDDAFNGEARVARSVNHLLVVGFYLINFGYVALNLRVRGSIEDARDSIETLSLQVGLVLLVLGGMHFFNLYIFSRIRRRTHLKNTPPPVAPSERLKGIRVESCSTDSGTADGGAPQAA
jgi:hypothetical protein